MKAKHTTKDKLGNPAVIATAVATQIPWGWLFKVGVGCVIVYTVVGSFKNRFKSLQEVSGYQPSNISVGAAKVKANIIYQAMRGFGNGFTTVRENIAGLNYNGWVRLYNAFGNRSNNVHIPFREDKNLAEWFQDEFSVDELSELRVLVGNLF